MHPLDRINELLDEVIEKTRDLERLEGTKRCRCSSLDIYTEEYGEPMCLDCLNKTAEIIEGYYGRSMARERI